MSKDVFMVDPIFFMPIDLEDNKNATELNKKSNIFENKNISDKNDLNCFEQKEKNENKNIITFSLNKNDPNIKSMTNSSKIYICEIFKRNWKLKSRRLIAKLKKKLIKQWNQYCLINFENNNKFVNDNFINGNIMKSNIINNKFDFYNNCINNNKTNLNHINDIIINKLNNNIYINNFNNINKFEINPNINNYITQCNNNKYKTINNQRVSENKSTDKLTIKYNNNDN